MVLQEILLKLVITISFVLIIYSAKKLSDRLLKNLLKNIEEKDKKTWIDWISKLFWSLIFFFLFLSILQYWGINITAMLAGVGIISIVIGLALQGTLSNIFSGIFLTMDMTLRVGDLIQIPEKNIIGRVEEINWRSTRIRTIENNIVYVPNSILQNSIIINYSRPSDVIDVWFEIGIGYFEDLDKVEKVTLKVAKKVQKCEYGSKNFEPKLYYSKFGDSNIHFYVILRAKDFLSIKPLVHLFIKELKKEYDKENIEISFPNVNVFMRVNKENYKIQI